MAELDAALKSGAPLNNKVIELRNAGQTEEAIAFLTQQAAPSLKRVLGALDSLVAYEGEQAAQAATEAETLSDSARASMIALGSVAVLLGAFVAWIITRSITQPINAAVSVAETVASGDLSSHIVVNSSDETGRLLGALKAMNTSLLGVVAQVRNGTDAISTASSEIAAGNLDLSSRTEEQASSLEETASAMEELTSTVKQNADNARQANQLAKSASEVAVRGGSIVSQVVDTMGTINASSKQDRRHHRRHRRHRLPDQHPGLERGRGSGARGRTGPRFCRRGIGSAQPGAALGWRSEGNQGIDRRLRRQRGHGFAPRQ